MRDFSQRIYQRRTVLSMWKGQACGKGKRTGSQWAIFRRLARILGEIRDISTVTDGASLIRVAALGFSHDPAAVGRNRLGKRDEVDTHFLHCIESDKALRNIPVPKRIR
jgi:hypothetical protein